MGICAPKKGKRIISDPQSAPTLSAKTVKPSETVVAAASSRHPSVSPLFLRQTPSVRHENPPGQLKSSREDVIQPVKRDIERLSQASIPLNTACPRSASCSPINCALEKHLGEGRAWLRYGS